MSTMNWRIPSSTLKLLSECPKTTAVTVLLRHSVRDELPPGGDGDTLPITQTGVTLAYELGSILGKKLRTLHSSPLTRCTQTAEALRSGADTTIPITKDRLLGDPGVFVVDNKIAWNNWEKLGHEGVMQHLVSAATPLPGMAPPKAAALTLTKHMLSIGAEDPGIHVFVTHDSLVTAAAARLLGIHLTKKDWPWFLEATFFWHVNNELTIRYRNHKGHLTLPQTTINVD